MKYKSKFLLAKTETVEDTFETLAGTDAVLTSNLDIQVYQGDRVSRNFDRDSLGASEEINVNPHNVISFDVEMQSSGAAGTAPAFGDLLECCGLEETVNAGTDVVYTPLSSGFSSLSASFLRLQDDADQMWVKTTGIKGNLAIELGKGAFPMFKFSSLMGTYYTPTQATAITSDTSDYVAPIAVTKDNTPTVTVDGTTACFSQFSMDLGNVIARRDAPNCRSTILSDRNVTGSITIVAPDLSTKNYFGDLESHAGVSTIPLVIEHGTTAGGIVNISLPTVQLKDIAQVDVDGDLGFQFSFSAIPTSAGNDEFELTFS